MSDTSEGSSARRRRSRPEAHAEHRVPVGAAASKSPPAVPVGTTTGTAVGSTLGGATNVAPITAIPLASRLRVPMTFDPIGVSGAGIASSLSSSRLAAVSNLYDGIQQVHTNLTVLLGTLADPSAPAQLIGTLAQPDGTPGSSLQIQFDPSSLGSTSPMATTVTDQFGVFHLALPSGLNLPSASNINLAVHGGNGLATVSIPAASIASNGFVPAVALPQYLSPIQQSILASLMSLASKVPGSTSPPPTTTPAQYPVVKTGENDTPGGLVYAANPTLDRFQYGVFHRLIEPKASIVSQVQAPPQGQSLGYFLPYYANAYIDAAKPADPTGDDGTVSYVDRIPLEQPISVDGFRDQMMGLQVDGTFTADETRPMAGTLGLGYTLWLAQRWTFQGLALGNLVYSLPLAPGEQQQVAIFERTDTAAVFESESFSEEQELQESALADTSTNATFNSAFNEAINGSSAFQTDSSSSSWGGSLILVSGGGGSSSSSGTSQSSLQGQRDTTQSAAQTTHSAAENQAAARRTAARTGMRVATASESEQVTTTTITNHNHTRALTMQYWEVQRIYNVSTTIEGLTMTVLVPLQVVRFMPGGQPQTLIDPNQLGSRTSLLDRYCAIVKHGDVLQQALPRKYQKGLNMLLEFAADPSATVDASSASAQDVINFSVSGSFLYCETVTITVVTSRGTRLGPAYLTSAAVKPPDDTFTTQDELVQWLTAERQFGSSTLTGAVALPPSVSRSDVVGFEIRRSFNQVSYTLASPTMQMLDFLETQLGPSANWINQALEYNLSNNGLPRSTVTISPANLESQIGGPTMQSFSAQVTDGGGVNEQYTPSINFGAQLPQQPYPVPAAHVPPVLKYQQILEIEKMASHVVRRTLFYSKAIWASMSAEERAVMLEAYTIGVPSGGLQDASQMVPLLNCVENRVLGYFGNSMMLPFIIPDSLVNPSGTSASSADGNAVGAGDGLGDGVDPSQIQEALLAFQMDGFASPQSTIALPTRGVLGEAVLGNSPSAEKIDLTRFWNWQDSPSDTAPSIQPVALPTTSPSIAAGLTAPNSLTQLPSLINNVLTAPTPDNSLLTALGADAASQKDFSTDLTGATQLASLLTNSQNNANAARQDALATTKSLTGQAMATIGNIVGGQDNPQAGSNAAAAMNGGSQVSATKAAKGTTPATGTKPGTAGPGGTPGAGGAKGGTAAGGTGTPGAGAATGATNLAPTGSLADLGGSGLDASSLGDLAVLAARAPTNGNDSVNDRRNISEADDEK
jgi:hypothetical protein